MPGEDERARQCVKRESAVHAVKKTPAYIITVLCKAERAKTPDPHDETLSKRKYEKAVQIWRASLRNTLRLIHRAQRPPTSEENE